MRTVVIADRDEAFAEALAADLRQAGFQVVGCPGPWPPRLRCVRCDVGYCPLTEGADIMVYQADLTGLDREGRAYNLALDSALAHPEIPLILLWHTPAEPEAVARILTAAPNSWPGPQDRAGLVRLVRELATAPVQLAETPPVAELRPIPSGTPRPRECSGSPRPRGGWCEACTRRSTASAARRLWLATTSTPGSSQAIGPAGGCYRRSRSTAP
jgi:hypothetical protein